MIPLADKRLVLVGAGVAIAAGVGLYFLVRYGKDAGKAIGQGAVDLASGTVLGIGAGFGLPDPSDANVAAQGKAALEAGNYLEASQKLPAQQFLAGVGSKLGLWWYEITHPNDGKDLTAGAASTVTWPPPSSGGGLNL